VDPLLNITVGSFRIVRKLGEGGMGSVYLGEHTVIGSKVAVKFLHRHLAVHDELVERFYAEARAVNLIGHENIVNIFDMNVRGERQYYLVMEYLDGMSLADRLEKEPLSPKEVVGILAQVCDALQAAHGRGVIHRDLKPENLYLLNRREGPPFVKVLDFGIAKLYGMEKARRTATGALVGTPEYMAPEQATGQEIDGRVDLYAIGIIAFQALTGGLPFTEGGLTGILLAHREAPVPPPPASVPKPLWAVVEKTLAKRREDRYPDAKTLREALESALKSTLAPEPRRPSTPLALLGSVAERGEAPRAATLVDLSKGGVYVLEDGKLPALMSCLRIALEFPPLTACDAEVVRTLTPDEAQRIGMRGGYALQFLSPSKEFRAAVTERLSGRARPSGRQPELDNPVAERALRRHADRPLSDPYALFGLPKDTESSRINQEARRIQRELEGLLQERLSPAQRERVEQLIAQVEAAREKVSSPRRRVGHDGRTGNFRGVARCLAAGLTVTELEAERARLLAERPGGEARAQIAFVSGKAWEAKGQLGEAEKEYEKALMLDPLNISFHQRYWGLRKKVG
jgi:serine/threonine-protein kinase